MTNENENTNSTEDCEVTSFRLVSERPEWAREAFTKACTTASLGHRPFYSPNREWTEYPNGAEVSGAKPIQHLVEFTKDGSRGKESFVLLFTKRSYCPHCEESENDRS